MPLKGITGEGSRKIVGAFFVDIAKTQLIDNQKNNVFFIIVFFLFLLLKAPACGGLLLLRGVEGSDGRSGHLCLKRGLFQGSWIRYSWRANKYKQNKNKV